MRARFQVGALLERVGKIAKMVGQRLAVNIDPKLQAPGAYHLAPCTWRLIRSNHGFLI